MDDRNNPIKSWLGRVEKLEARPSHLRDLDIKEAIENDLDVLARANVAVGKSVENVLSEYRSLAVDELKERIASCNEKGRIQFYEQIIGLLGKH